MDAGDSSSSSNNNQNPPANKKRAYSRCFRGGNRFNTFNRPSGPRERPVSIQIPQFSNRPNETDNSQLAGPSNALEINVPPPEPASFRIDNKAAEYPGWNLYFPQEEYKADLPLVRKIKAFEEHIKQHPLVYKLSQIRQQLWFPLSLQRLLADTNFLSKWKNFVVDLNEATEETLLCAGLATHQLILKHAPPITMSQLSGIETTSKLTLLTIRARVQGHSPIISLRSLKIDNYNRLISVRGTVIRVSAPEMVCSWMTYRCSLCNCEQAIRQTDRLKSIAPTSCKSKSCHARSNFQMLLSSPFTRTEVHQTIRLQESMQNAENGSMGKIPKTIEVELAYDLVDSVYPGDDIILTGIIKVKANEQNAYQKGQRGNVASLHKFYIYGVSVVSNKNSMNVRNSEFSEKEMELIQQIRDESNPFKLFVHSLCPMIFGHEMVKAGMILALFGGTGNGEKANKAPGAGRRADIHILVIGDPGLGKSHLLQACANVSPRGIFVCGNSTSNAGLTVSIRHEKGAGSSLEAGALVLADQGICCIDEFDKMSANYQSLLQVMEQQTVSVAKAGVVCALPARTCILAAANPSGGHYNKAKSVSENLKVWPTLLSRFDLVFILLDHVDAHLDDLLTTHIQKLQENKNKRDSYYTNSSGPNQQSPTQSFSMSSQQSIDQNEQNVPLYEQLKIHNHHGFRPIPSAIMQKYIGYAKKYCFPTLSIEAARELKAFYTKLRATRPGVDSIPVTTRQLEALIRMTQARARVELAAEATLQHALDVLSIFRYTMVDVLSTNVGTLQMSRNLNGSGMSLTTQVKKYLQVLQQQAKTIFTFDELKEVAEMSGFQQNIRQIIDSLNVQGFLIKRGSDIYKFVT